MNYDNKNDDMFEGLGITLERKAELLAVINEATMSNDNISIGDVVSHIAPSLHTQEESFLVGCFIGHKMP